MKVTEHRTEPQRLYRTEIPNMSADTFENRFLKYAVKSVSQKFTELKNRILENYPMDSNIRFIESLGKTEEEMKRLVHHPFFRTIGNFKGMSQESLTLKQGTGYSQIYRIWLLLTCSYDLEEGIRSLELKDIATLYEIWCFIEVKNLVKTILGEDNLLVDNQSRIELNKYFTYSLTKGQKSKIVFSRTTSEGDPVELAEVIYNPKGNTKTAKNETSIDHTYSFTVPQKPDIVLQLTRRDIETGFKLTYLFDAKYRIDQTDGNGIDTPPDDAINQMHRYRDALYYDPGQEGLPIKKRSSGRLHTFSRQRRRRRGGQCRLLSLHRKSKHRCFSAPSQQRKQQKTSERLSAFAHLGTTYHTNTSGCKSPERHKSDIGKKWYHSGRYNL